MNLISKVLSISLVTLATCICGTGMFINLKEKATISTIVSTDRVKADLKKKYTQCVNNANARYRGRMRQKQLDKCVKP